MLSSHPKLRKTLIILLVSGFIVGILGLSSVAILFYWASRDLPNITKIADYNPAQATTVLARDGSVLGTLYHQKRYMVSLSGMSKYIPLSFLAAEDDAFYRHKGVDPVAILRATIVNFRRGSITQGGSTITQQIIKQLLLSSERKLQRKIKEAILAYRLESYLTKDEILTIYLNQIFLGQQSFGVEAAARTYFGKHATDITLAESAVLAGLPQAPSRYNPFRHPSATKARQMYVLGRLHDLKWISSEEYEQAIHEPLVYWTMPEYQGGGARWYMEEVRRLLIEYFNENNLKTLGIDTALYKTDYVYEAGLTVRTAMDPLHQRAATSALKKGLEDLSKRQGWHGAIKHIPAEEQADFISKMSFSPYDIVGGTWAQALVTEVSKKKAAVALGNGQKGYVTLDTFTWARKPNPRIPGIYAPSIKDANKVLKVGDLIWVKAQATKKTITNAKGKKVPQEIPYDPSNIKKDVPIALSLEQRPPAQGAIASIEPLTGDVVALVGGYKFGDSHFNRATQAKRQPGSSFKPFVYSASLDLGFTASTKLLDAPFVYINEYTNVMWKPLNYDRKYKGELPLHTALALSRNTCTVRVAQEVGIANVIARAKALGIEADFPQELSVSLGAIEVTPLNLTQAYTGFANLGMVSKPRIITSITDAQGRELYKQEPQHWQAISPENAFIMATLLKEAVNRGTGSRAKVLDIPVAGKTGTTNSEHDAWFVGFTPHLVTGVYIGYDQLKPLGRFEGGARTATPIFVSYMQKIDTIYPPDDFTVPENIVMYKGQAYKADEPMYGTIQMSEEEMIIDQEAEDLLKQLF